MQPIGKICPRAKGTDESSSLLAAERMALVLNAKEILLYFSNLFAKYQLICNQLRHLHHNHYADGHGLMIGRMGKGLQAVALWGM